LDGRVAQDDAPVPGGDDAALAALVVQLHARVDQDDLAVVVGHHVAGDHGVADGHGHALRRHQLLHAAVDDLVVRGAAVHHGSGVVAVADDDGVVVEGVRLPAVDLRVHQPQPRVVYLPGLVLVEP